MADDDEEVLFEGSALYRHLKDAGFSAEEIGADKHPKNDKPKKVKIIPPPPESHHNKNGSASFTRENNMDTTYHRQWDPYRVEIEQVRGKAMCDDILEAGVLDEQDDDYLHNLITVFSRNDKDCLPQLFYREEFFKNRFFMLGMLVALGTYSIPRFTNPDVTWADNWQLDIAAILLTAVLIQPWINRLIRHTILYWKHGLAISSTISLLKRCKLLSKWFNKSIRLIQEMELVARGFSIVAPRTVATNSQTKSPERQCPELRRLVFLTCRDAMLSARQATRSLISKCSLPGEVLDGGSLMAQSPLEEYGPCVQAQSEEKLRVATDQYSLEAIKGMSNLCSLHISELLTRLAVGCIMAPKTHKSVLEIVAPCISPLETLIGHQLNTLMDVYRIHNSSVLEPKQRSMKKSRNNVGTFPNIFTALHSLDLHMQAALRKVRELGDQVEEFCESGMTDELLTRDLQEDLNFEMHVILGELEACRDCYGETSMYINQDKSTKKKEGKSDLTVTAVPGSSKPDDPVIELNVPPIIQDQVFEAYTDPFLEDEGSIKFDPEISVEEQEKKKRERLEAVRLMKELKSVISVRGRQWEEREMLAKLKMQGLSLSEIEKTMALWKSQQAEETPPKKTMPDKNTKTKDAGCDFNSTDSESDIEEIEVEKPFAKQSKNVPADDHDDKFQDVKMPPIALGLGSISSIAAQAAAKSAGTGMHFDTFGDSESSEEGSVTDNSDPGEDNNDDSDPDENDDNVEGRPTAQSND